MYPLFLLPLFDTRHRAGLVQGRGLSRARGVLAEFGVDIAADVEVRVWDSTAELRYLVIPQRPAGTDDMSEAELAGLVTRNSMIGTDRELGRE